MMDVIYPKARAFLGSRGWVSGLELKIHNECLVHLNSYFLQFTQQAAVQARSPFGSDGRMGIPGTLHR